MPNYSHTLPIRSGSILLGRFEINCIRFGFIFIYNVLSFLLASDAMQTTAGTRFHARKGSVQLFCKSNEETNQTEKFPIFRGRLMKSKCCGFPMASFLNCSK